MSRRENILNNLSHTNASYRAFGRDGLPGVQKMTEKKKIIVTAGVTLAVYISIKYFLPYVIPFLIAWILVRTVNPLLKKIRSRIPWKKEVLVSILVFLVFLLAGIVIYYLYQAVVEQLCRILSRSDQYYAQLSCFLDDCCISLENRTGLKASRVRSVVNRGLESLENQLHGKWIPGMLDHSFQYLAGIMKMIGFVFIVYIAMLLLMKDYDRIRSDMEKYEIYQNIKHVTDRILKIGGAYLKSQFLIMAVVTALCIAGLYLLKNSYALLLGLVIGLLDALPFLGTGTVLLPWAAVLVFKRKYLTAAGYVILFLVTNGAREFLEPKLVGERIGIYPFAFALSVYAGLCLFGPTGVFTGPVGIILIMEISREIINTVKY